MTRQCLLGDCLELLPTLADESIDGVFTDPPYNINLNPQRKTHGTIANDALTEEQFRYLLHRSSAQIFRLLKPNSVAWFCCNWQCLSVFDEAIKKAGFRIATVVVWVKNIWGLGYHFRPQHEFIICAFKGGPALPTEAVSNVWNVPRLVNTLHPTEKPLELVQMALKRYCKEGDIILDPFAGVFSTCLAAKRLDMGYIGIELLKNYYDIGRERLDSSVCMVKNQKGNVVVRDENQSILDYDYEKH
jgi:adenine-specific DNA-methyltransferase